jgi:hypothetical protein
MAKKKVTWLGVASTMEFHRLVEGEEHDARCNLDKINPKNKWETRTARELRDADYDAAKWCNHRFRSRENT